MACNAGTIRYLEISKTTQNLHKAQVLRHKQLNMQGYMSKHCKSLALHACTYTCVVHT